MQKFKLKDGEQDRLRTAQTQSFVLLKKAIKHLGELYGFDPSTAAVTDDGNIEAEPITPKVPVQKELEMVLDNGKKAVANLYDAANTIDESTNRVIEKMLAPTPVATDTSLVKVDPKEFGLDEMQAQKIENAFIPVITERNALAQMYSEIIVKEITPELAKEAGQLRLKLVKVRTGTGKIHKAEKAFYLAGGRFVDAWNNRNVVAIEHMEEKLSEIENYYANLEKKRIADLQTLREAMLVPYNVENVAALNLGAMAEAVWTNFLSGTKAGYEAKLAAEKKALDELIAKEKEEAQERENQRLENERLKKDAVEKEKAMAAERAKQEAILKMEREKADKLLEAQRAQAAKEKAAADAKLKAANDERERLLREAKEKDDAAIKARKDAEQKEKERLAAEKRAAKAPDKVKLKTWVASISIAEINLTQPECMAAAKVIQEKFNAFKVWANSQIENI